MIDCKNILLANGQAEDKLRVLAGRETDSCRSEFAVNPPTLQHLVKLKEKFLKPFVQAPDYARIQKEISRVRSASQKMPKLS